MSILAGLLSALVALVCRLLSVFFEPPSVPPKSSSAGVAVNEALGLSDRALGHALWELDRDSGGPSTTNTTWKTISMGRRHQQLSHFVGQVTEPRDCLVSHDAALPAELNRKLLRPFAWSLLQQGRHKLTGIKI